MLGRIMKKLRKCFRHRYSSTHVYCLPFDETGSDNYELISPSTPTLSALRTNKYRIERASANTTCALQRNNEELATSSDILDLKPSEVDTCSRHPEVQLNVSTWDEAYYRKSREEQSRAECSKRSQKLPRLGVSSFDDRFRRGRIFGSCCVLDGLSRSDVSSNEYEDIVLNPAYLDDSFSWSDETENIYSDVASTTTSLSNSPYGPDAPIGRGLHEDFVKHAQNKSTKHNGETPDVTSICDNAQSITFSDEEINSGFYKFKSKVPNPWLETQISHRTRDDINSMQREPRDHVDDGVGHWIDEIWKILHGSDDIDDADTASLMSSSFDTPFMDGTNTIYEVSEEESSPIRGRKHKVETEQTENTSSDSDRSTNCRAGSTPRSLWEPDVNDSLEDSKTFPKHRESRDFVSSKTDRRKHESEYTRFLTGLVSVDQTAAESGKGPSVMDTRPTNVRRNSCSTNSYVGNSLLDDMMIHNYSLVY